VNKLATTQIISLPTVSGSTTQFVAQLTQSLGFPREILSSDADIAQAWTQLPDLLNRIPAELRDPLLARMCVAVSVGLMDSAINYAWNSAMSELRNKIRRFGIAVVPQITGKPFDEKALSNLQDSELLSLSLNLNLITEDGYFMLDQSRDVRNNFSAAHPTIGQIDAYEFGSFLSRCAKHALNNAVNPKGVDTVAFIQAVKSARFDDLQRFEWVNRVEATHQAQRESLVLTLHGIYCDPSVAEESRLNALDIAAAFSTTFTDEIRSELIDRHFGYVQKQDAAKLTASQQFFTNLGLLGLLSDSEKHTIVANAAKRLMSVHQGWNNFHNEQPFAERLAELSKQMVVPPTAREEYVRTVMTCLVGNPYGTADTAEPHYVAMVRGFTPAEIATIFETLQKQNPLTARLKSVHRCRLALGKALSNIDEKSVPMKYKTEFDNWKAWSA
jgi:hypothetical protein